LIRPAIDPTSERPAETSGISSAARSDPTSPKRTSVAGSTFLVMAASIVSALLGFGREVISAHYYGTRAEMDAFINASTVPTIVLEVFNGALVTALVPTFSEYLRRGSGDEARRLGSTILNALFFVMSALAALGWLLAPYFVPVIAHGFPPAEQQLVVTMVRWLMPGMVATTLSGVCAALLNANHRFLASALVWVAANLVTISLVIALHSQLGIFALVLGSVLGLFAQLLVQLPSIFRHRLYRFELDLRHPGLGKVWALLVPVAAGSGAGQMSLAFDRYFASTLKAGSTAALGYTTKLAFLPVLIVATALATVIFPLIASQFASDDRAGMRRSVTLALRMVSFIVIPCAAGFIALAYPIVQALFERGAFGPASTALCASLVPFACLPLIAYSYSTVLGRACYACRAVRPAVWASLATVAINVGLSATLLPILGARGLLLSNGVSGCVLIVLQIAMLRSPVGGLEWRSLLSSCARIVFASIVMAAALYWVRSVIFIPTDTLASRALYLADLLVIGATVFLGVAPLLRIEEFSIVLNTLQQKFSRNVLTVP
jgi:putative peptidoglycan lipid II flippase